MTLEELPAFIAGWIQQLEQLRGFASPFHCVGIGRNGEMAYFRHEEADDDVFSTTELASHDNGGFEFPLTLVVTDSTGKHATVTIEQEVN